MKNDAFSLFRNISIFFSEGGHFSEIFSLIGVDSICIYGMGEMGTILLNDLRSYGTLKILATFDRKNNKTYDELIRYGCPIVVTPIGHYEEIRKILIEEGIDGKRIISLAQIFSLYFYLRKCHITNFSLGNSKEFLIVGANFDNKGSEAMTFVTIKELRRRYNNCAIWFCPNFWDTIYEKRNYRMIVLEDGREKGSVCSEIIPRLTGIIDVSGYCVSSERGFGDTERTLNYIKMAYEFNIPYYFMPQSFGPLDYPKYKLAEMKELFSYAKVVYAREDEGKRILEKVLGLSNVSLSADMVLQCPDLKKRDVYLDIKENKKKECCIASGGVAIVPNSNLLRYHSVEELVNMYFEIIDYLLSFGKKVYIVSHSNESAIIHDLKARYDGNESVIVLDYLYDCFAFSETIQHADFVISSRYHALAHAYKLFIPCIAIGWSSKYNGLMRIMGQEDYLYDIREKIDISKICRMIDKLETKKDVDLNIIRKKMRDIQSENCFAIFDDPK